MNKTISVVLIAALAAVLPAQNLLKNPSFEDNNGETGAGRVSDQWFNFRGSPDAWSNDGSFGLAPGEFARFNGVSAQDGKVWMGITSTNGNLTESIGQTLEATLVPGTEYIVSAWLHLDNRSLWDNPGDVLVRLGNTTSDVFTVGTLGPINSPDDGWVQFSTTFVAPSDAADYSVFAFEAQSILTDGDEDSYIGIDNASLQVVPEPATMLALGAGLAALAARRRRK